MSTLLSMVHHTGAVRIRLDADEHGRAAVVVNGPGGQTVIHSPGAVGDVIEVLDHLRMDYQSPEWRETDGKE